MKGETDKKETKEEERKVLRCGPIYFQADSTSLVQQINFSKDLWPSDSHSYCAEEGFQCLYLQN